MNKATPLLLIVILLILSCSQTQRNVLDLKEESVYAQKQGGIFAVNLLKPEGEPYVMGGWSAVRKDGTRLGVYPVSRLNIPVFEKEPFYLFFKCEPFVRDQIPAEGFRFRMRNRDIVQVELLPVEENSIKVSLLPEILELGDNILQIHHVLDEEIEKEINQEDKQRIRTAVFKEMMLSSHPDYDLTKKFIQTKQRVDFNRQDVLIQKVPSTLDYYVDLPANARLNADYEFIPSNPSIQQIPIAVTISLKQQGKEEDIIHQKSLGFDQTGGKVRIDIPNEKRESRLRFKAGEGEDSDSIEGLLIWKKASVVVKPEKKTKQSKLDENFLEWKRSLADKNTVIIILDAARADHFSSYGYFRPTTPNLDKFAEDAVLFTQVFSEALTTRASIGTLFTGFPLTVLSLYSITSQIPEELTTLAQMFQQKQIKTTGFAGVGNVSSSFGFDRGFDQYFELYREEEFYRKSQEYLPYIFPWLEANRDNRFFCMCILRNPMRPIRRCPRSRGCLPTHTRKRSISPFILILLLIPSRMDRSSMSVPVTMKTLPVWILLSVK